MRSSKSTLWICLIGALLLASATLQGAGAATTPLSNNPVTGTGNAIPKPNVMLLMDTSRSMAFTHMPDELEAVSLALPVGYRSAQCNSLYYNPAGTYELPKAADGTLMGQPIFSAASLDGYAAGSATVNLESAFQAFTRETRTLSINGADDTPQQAYYYVFTRNGASAPTLAYDTAPCTDMAENLVWETVNDKQRASSPSGNGTWVREHPTTADQKEHFARWFTYYRTRMAMVKSTMSLAFNDSITSGFRIGLISMNPLLNSNVATSGVNPAKYLAIDDFNDTQRGLWYSKLFSQTPAGPSPAREGLARVGRHYGGKEDSINTGMPADPSPPICRQNFTIMTTDGYWNKEAESVGPVRLDGSTLVGQQDGNLTPRAVLDRTNPLNYSHRPMWDGNTSGTRTDSDRQEMSRYADCETGDFFKSTSIWRQSTTQDTRRTQSLTRTTEQIRVSTAQTSKSTEQQTQITETETRQTFQVEGRTQQHSETVTQQNQRVYWYSRGTSVIQRTDRRVMRTDRYIEKTVIRHRQREVRVTETKTKIPRRRETFTQSWTQPTKTTQQTFSTNSRWEATRTRQLASTSQRTRSTSQANQRTVQYLAYNGATETTTAVLSCTPSQSITCFTLNTGPTPVAVCQPDNPVEGNEYVRRTCDAPTVTGPTPVASCTDESANSGNSFTSVTCNTVTTTSVPVASCTAQTTPTSGNSFTVTACETVTQGATHVASCTNAEPTSANSFWRTTCNEIKDTPVAVALCTPVPAGLVRTACNTVTDGPTPVAAGTCVGAVASSSNEFMRTTCNVATGTASGVCTPGTTTSADFKTTVCSSTVQNDYVSSCSEATNGSVQTTCPATETIHAAKPVASCTPANASAATDWVKTACKTSNGNWTNLTGVCTPAAASEANGYVGIECQPGTPANTRVASCTEGPSNAGMVTCNNNAVDGPRAVASCTPATGITTTTCETQTTTYPVGFGQCWDQAAAEWNGWTQMSCQTISSSTTVGSCNGQWYTAPSAENGWTEIRCGEQQRYEAVQIGTCVERAPAESNGWVGIQCLPLSVQTRPVLLNSCVAQTGDASNSWVERTCATPDPTEWAAVQNCVGGTSSDFIFTECQPKNSEVERVIPGSCTASESNAGNQYTRTVCTPTRNVVGVAPGTCQAQAPVLANGFERVSCETVNTGPTFVAAESCSDAGPTEENQYTKTHCSTATTGPTLVAACSPGTDGNFKVTTCDVTRDGPTAFAPATVCSPADPSESNNFTRTTCNRTDVTVGVPANSCVPSAPEALTVVSCATVTTPIEAVASCTEGTNGNHLTTTCTREMTDPVRTSSCTAVAPTSASGFQEVICTPVPGLKIQTRTRTRQSTYTVSGSTPLLPTGVHTDWVETNWTDVAGGVCYADPVKPPEVDLSAQWRPSTTGMPGGCTAWPCAGEVNTGTAVRGSENSLADVAQYYYVTDLRSELEDKVSFLGEGIEDDRAPWQHMTTFVVGLGVSGTLGYDSNYKGATTGDFAKIRNYDLNPGLNWPIWPTAENLTEFEHNDPRSIDDFWHTAVNGRGKYFSARDPQSVISGLHEAMVKIKAQAGAGSGAAVSTRAPVPGDNMAYTAAYTSLEWSGELQAREMDPKTGQLSDSVTWSAQTLLNARVGQTCDSRNIYARDPATGVRVNFSWNTFSCDTSGAPTGSGNTGLTPSMQALFTDTSKLQQWTHYVSMTADQRSGAGGAKLVNFLRGQRAHEGFMADSLDKLYRSRTSVLGDIVNSESVYVKAPSANYQDSGYGTFKAAHVDRQAMIYVGANDGMLHAFNASTGKEEWGFVPQGVMANMWRLADANYGENHHFFVDGTPTVGDVNVGGSWKTLLVGGLNNGGNSYYALDVTNPTNPQPMWEFTVGSCAVNPVGATQDCNLGKTYGRPLISKLEDGTWVVMVTSGYNNVEQPGSDGGGYLYVLNAANGAIISRIATGAGSSASPSGLREINYFVNNQAFDNTALRVYGGDVLGNVWRFDINDKIAPSGKEATLLGTAIAGGAAQPITTRPELADVSGETMVMVGTGKILAEDDLIDSSVQSVYGFKDPMTATAPAYADLRGALKPMKMSQTGSGSSAGRTIACDSEDEGVCANSTGWYVDLPDGGERVSVSMQVVQGMLVFASNVPSDAMCRGGGYSWLNYVNLITGEAVDAGSGEGASVSQHFFLDAMTVGFTVIRTPEGLKALGTSNDGRLVLRPLPDPSPVPQGKRISWREITR